MPICATLLNITYMSELLCPYSRHSNHIHFSLSALRALRSPHAITHPTRLRDEGEGCLASRYICYIGQLCGATVTW